jgi:hypothetical protein
MAHLDAGSGRRPPHQEETLALQQTALLFDHLIGTAEQRDREGEAERS